MEKRMREKTRQVKTELLIFFFFFLAVYLRFSINGFNFSYPGNLKSVDAFIHAIHTGWVVDSHQILKTPFYMAYGYEDVVFFHPLLLYIIPATYSMWTGLESHNTIWLYVVFVSALPVLIAYLIGSRIFKSHSVGILSSALFILPATEATKHAMPQIFQLYWLFPTYIGLWNVVMGKTLFAIQIWLIWELLKEPRRWVSLLLGIVTAAQMLSHISETAVAAPLIFAAYILLFKRDFKSGVASFKYFITLPTISFTLFIPKVLNVWLKTKEVGYLNLEASIFDNLDFMAIFWKPVLVLYAVGLIILFYRWKENRYWLLITGYLLFWIGLVPLFYTNEEYIGKLRFLAPAIVFPVAAYGVVKTFDYIWKERLHERVSERWKGILIGYIAVIFIVAGVAQYGAVKQTLAYEELAAEKHDALLWIQKNTMQDSKVLLLDGFNMASGLYSRRVTFQRDWNEYTGGIEDFEPGKNISSQFNGRWLEELHNLPFEKSFFAYDYHPLPRSTVTAEQFDYIILWDFNQEAAAYNQAAAEYLASKNFRLAHRTEKIMILERKDDV